MCSGGKDPRVSDGGVTPGNSFAVFRLPRRAARPRTQNLPPSSLPPPPSYPFVPRYLSMRQQRSTQQGRSRSAQLPAGTQPNCDHNAPNGTSTEWSRQARMDLLYVHTQDGSDCLALTAPGPGAAARHGFPAAMFQRAGLDPTPQAQTPGTRCAAAAEAGGSAGAEPAAARLLTNLPQLTWRRFGVPDPGADCGLRCFRPPLFPLSPACLPSHLRDGHSREDAALHSMCRCADAPVSIVCAH